MAIITQEEAAAHLRIVLSTDGGSPPVVDDIRAPDLNSKMALAEAIVLDYIDKSEDDLAASGVSANWLPLVKAAVLIVLSGLWDDRIGSDGGDYLAEGGAVARLLWRIRKPTLA